MRPGHVLVEADADEGETVQRRAGHIVNTRQSQVCLIPGATAEPGLVGVTQQHTLAAARGIAAQRQAVAATINVAQFSGRSFQRSHSLIQRIGCRDSALIGARSGQDGAAEQALFRAATQGFPAQEEEEVDAIDGIDPIRVATAIFPLGQVIQPRFLKVPVHAAAIPGGKVTRKLRQRRHELLGKGIFIAVEKAEQEVRLDIAHVLAHEFR